MSVHDGILLAFGPSLFPGIRVREWVRLLRENAFRIQPVFAMRAMSISACSIVNSALGRYEESRFGASVRHATVSPPLFILGHWRSGTTLLQNLLALDSRFASPTLFDVLFPHTCLTADRLLRRPLSLLLPSKRPTDNVPVGFDTPHEDEFAVCAMTLCSPHISMVFPLRCEYYDCFLTLRGLPQAAVMEWQHALMKFAKKLTVKYGRPLVLKSPPHTARVRILLELFPGAKFLHIYRDPYIVFQSTLRTMISSSRRQRLQRSGRESFEDRVLRVFKVMYDAYFEDRALIPDGHLHEVRYEDLISDMAGVMHNAYDALRLPSFEEARAAVGLYADAARHYQTAKYHPMGSTLRRRVAQDWQRCFDEWSYPM